MRGLPFPGAHGSARRRPGRPPRGSHPAMRSARLRPRERWRPPGGEMPPDHLGDVRWIRHALRPRPRAASIPPARPPRQAEEVRGHRAVHGGPAVWSVADVAGDALVRAIWTRVAMKARISFAVNRREEVAEPTSGGPREARESVSHALARRVSVPRSRRRTRVGPRPSRSVARRPGATPRRPGRDDERSIRTGRLAQGLDGAGDPRRRPPWKPPRRRCRA